MKPGVLLHRIFSFGLKGVVALILAEFVFLAISITAALVALSIDSLTTSLLCLVLVFFLLNRIALDQVVSSLIIRFTKKNGSEVYFKNPETKTGANTAAHRTGSRPSDGL